MFRWGRGGEWPSRPVASAAKISYRRTTRSRMGSTWATQALTSRHYSDSGQELDLDHLLVRGREGADCSSPCRQSGDSLSAEASCCRSTSDACLEFEDDFLTFAPRGGQNKRMTRQETTKPFQFRLRSIFLVTAAVGVALGLLKWLGPRGLLTVVFFTAPIAATAAILVKNKGGWASLWASFLLVLVVWVAILLMIGLYLFCGGR